MPGVPGTVLTLPSVYLQGFATDGQGAFSQPVPGGGGPVSFVVQVAVLDPKGIWRVSNGIQTQFLP